MADVHFRVPYGLIPKMDISHWDAAIHYGVQLAQYCDQTLSC